MKRLTMVLALGAAVLALTAGPATAQAAPSVTISPTSVSAPGEIDVTVTGKNFPDGTVYLIKCKKAATASGEVDPPTDCNVNEAVDQATAAGGTFTKVVSKVTVTAAGATIISSNNGGSVSVFSPITVGAGSSPSALASTGIESTPILLMALGLIAAAAVVLGTTRRRARA